MSKDFSRGSEWHKWDLHVHSPASLIESYNGDYNDFIKQLALTQADVVGINDYYSIEGFREILARIENIDLETEPTIKNALETIRDTKVLFPVIELRMSNILYTKAYQQKHLDFHLIFSPSDIHGEKTNAEYISEIINFIKSLKDDTDQPLSERYNTDKIKEFFPNFFDAIKSLEKNAILKDNFLVYIPYDEYGGIDEIDPKTNKLIKEFFVKNSDLLGSSNQKQIDFFLWKGTKFSDEELKNWLGGHKGCIKGSDSHDKNYPIGCLKDANSQPTSRALWIKADLTFEGLKQAVCDPKDRIFIGEEPELLIRARANGEKYLKEIKLSPHEGIKSIWFDQSIPLNPGLVSIIGKKGSGKSALADILALSTEIHHKTDDLTFAKKFRNNLGGYNSTLSWNASQGGVLANLSLGEAFENMKVGKNKNKIVRAKYIPQNYLENLCNPDKPDNIDDLQAAIDEVIYSYLSDDERTKYETLKALIEDKTSDIKARVGFKQVGLAKKIDEVCALEERFGADYRAQLENKIEGLHSKIQEHREKIKLYPKIELPKASEELNKQLQSLNVQIGEIDKKISEATKNKSVLTGKIITIGTIREKLTTLVSQVKTSMDDIEQVCADGKFEISDGKFLSVADIVKFSTDAAPLSAQETKIKLEIAEIELSLNTKEEDLAKTGLLDKKAKLEVAAKEITDGMDSQTKIYQNRVDARKKIAQDICDLHGAYDKPDTLLHITSLLDNIPNDDAMVAKYDEVITMALEIYGIKTELKTKLEEIYAPIQEIIKKDGLLQTGALNIMTDMRMKETWFKDRFFEYIKQNIKSSFKDAGAEVLSDMISKFDFTKDTGVGDFLKTLIDKFRYIGPAVIPDSETSTPRECVTLADLFKTNRTIKDFYNFLFSLEYIEPKYSLKLDGRDLLQLSPGERGALLLIFYLLLDTSDVPLIIDQPEENLDNESIYKLLVPAIKEARNKKQIIMVTHNPNLAVVCDSDQIICAEKDMTRTPVIKYALGAIENLAIRGKIIDILEGTKPAFQKREEKYDLT